MKRTILLLNLVVMTAIAVMAQDNADKAEINFKEKEHDFGYIAENGGKVSCEFEFTNTGKAPLIIIDAVASCGCTKPEFPKKPLQPGEKGVIKVTYNPKGRPGPFRKDIRVRTNAGSKRVTLIICGSVNPEAKQAQ